MDCTPVRGDNPRALASGLSYVQVDKHGITILYHLHQCGPCSGIIHVITAPKEISKFLKMEHFNKLLGRSRRVLLYSRDCIRKVPRVYTEIVYAQTHIPRNNLIVA